MMLEEANARLKKTKINEDQLWAIHSLYILLDLHKDDFCKIIDTLGLDAILNKQRHYDRLVQAEEELAAKEKYLQAKARLRELENEKLNLEQVIDNYKSIK